MLGNYVVTGLVTKDPGDLSDLAGTLSNCPSHDMPHTYNIPASDMALKDSRSMCELHWLVLHGPKLGTVGHILLTNQFEEHISKAHYKIA